MNSKDGKRGKNTQDGMGEVFWMPAARVRVPGGAPFSQLQQRREKDNSDS